MGKHIDRQINILASDFDGTLQYNGKITEDDLFAIAKFRAQGNKFGIVTGRGSDDISCLSHVPADFVICATGTVILDAQKRVIYRNPGVLGDYMAPILALARELGCTYFHCSSNFQSHDLLFDCEGLYGREFEQCNTHFGTLEAAYAFTEYVDRHFSAYISAFMNGSYIDMPAVGNSKVSGVSTYAARFSNAVVYTIGDNYNDIDMINVFHGIAVENAVDELKTCAQYQAKRVADAISYISDR